MKKKFIIIVLICILAILIIPIPSQLNDGGSVQYTAILYQITDYHRINMPDGYTEGVGVKILGLEVFNNSKVIGDTDNPHSVITSDDDNSDVKGGEQDYFNGEVLAINDNSIKVKCLDVTKGDVTEGTELNVTKDVVSANGVPSIKVGDTIRVVYTGIRETYPPQLQTVFAIYLVDESGKVIP